MNEKNFNLAMNYSFSLKMIKSRNINVFTQYHKLIFLFFLNISNFQNDDFAFLSSWRDDRDVIRNIFVKKSLILKFRKKFTEFADNNNNNKTNNFEMYRKLLEIYEKIKINKFDNLENT